MSARSAGTVVRTHRRAVLLCEGADALADAVRAGRQGRLAGLDLLHDLAAPIAGIGAPGDGCFGADATDRERRDRKTYCPLGRNHRGSLGENGHVKTSLEICGVVLRLGRIRGRAAGTASFRVKLLFQPPIESVAVFHAHSSKGTVDGCAVPKSLVSRSPRRVRRRALAAASRDATVRSGTFSAAPISRFVYPCRCRRMMAAACFGGSAFSSRTRSGWVTSVGWGRPRRRRSSPTSCSRSRRRWVKATLSAIRCIQASAGASCFQ